MFDRCMIDVCNLFCVYIYGNVYNLFGSNSDEIWIESLPSGLIRIRILIRMLILNTNTNNNHTKANTNTTLVVLLIQILIRILILSSTIISTIQLFKCRYMLKSSASQHFNLFSVSTFHYFNMFNFQIFNMSAVSRFQH